MFIQTLLVLVVGAIYVHAGAINPPEAPTVKLDSATFTGNNSGSVSQFLGIPFAKPP